MPARQTAKKEHQVHSEPASRTIGKTLVSCLIGALRVAGLVSYSSF